MLLVLETIEEHKVEVLLARETFDQKMAPLKAWVAQMELDGMKERMTMGVKARLKAGKANTGQDRYGYRRVGEKIEIVEQEAKWVRQVLAWYLEGTPKQEIRRRLIAAEAPQKGSSIPRRVQWAISSIDAVIFHTEEYASGIKIQTRKGDRFEIPCPPIIDWSIHEQVSARRQANKTYPARNLKHDYLVGGLMYCDCGRRWSSRTHRHRGKRKHHNTIGGEYYCTQPHRDMQHPDCPHTIGSKKVDDYVWTRVCEVIADPIALMNGARGYIEELQQRSENLEADRSRIQDALATVATERQWVITQARRGRIADTDMDQQLEALRTQEVDLQRELMAVQADVGLTSLVGWEERAESYIAAIREEIHMLNAVPQTDEERQEQFRVKREIVQMLVKRIDIGRDRELRLTFQLDVAALLKMPIDFDPNKAVGTYNHTRSFLPLPASAAAASPSPPACRSAHPAEQHLSAAR